MCVMWACSVGQKLSHRLMGTILLIFNRNFVTGRFLGKFAVKWVKSEIPPHFAYVATLPCETLMSAKQAINDKLQGSVATHLRYGGVVNKQIKKGLLLSLRVIFLIGKYLSKLQARTWLSRALVRLANTLLKDGESAQNNHVLVCNFAKYWPILKFLLLSDSAINLS